MRITGAHIAIAICLVLLIASISILFPPVTVISAIAIWFLLLVAAVAIAAVQIFKQRSKGILTAILTIFGALFMAAFVSAVIGLYDLNGYFFTLQFAASIAIGVVGLALFGWGARRAWHGSKGEAGTQAKPLQTGSETALPRHTRAQ